MIAARRNSVERRLLATAADQCAKWLKASNIEVLALDSSHATPVIIVRHCPECDRFEGIVKAYQRGPNWSKRYSFVIRMGCEIRWNEPEKQVAV